MNKDQNLSGFDSNGDSNMEINFNTPNTVKIIHKPTNTEVASFGVNGSTFSNLMPGESLPGGSLNRLTHPGFIPQYFSDIAVATVPGHGNWLGPNTYLWQAGSGSGVMSVRRNYKLGAASITHAVSETFCLEAVVSSACKGAGIRLWLHDPYLGYGSTIQNSNKVYVSVLGPLGKNASFRVGRSGSYTSQSYTGTGEWERIAIQVPTHIQSNSFIDGGTFEPYAIDMLYEAEEGTWYLQEPTMQCVDKFTVEIYQYRSLAERISSAEQVWYQPAGVNLYGKASSFINFPIPLPIYNDPYYTYDVKIISSDYPVLVKEKTNKGFTLSTSTENSNFWSANLSVAIRGPLTDLA